MIVTCENCETSFQLDESRVPPQGIRVRCSRCKEAFFLAHPSSSASEAIHGAAEEAAVGSAAPAPARDLPTRSNAGKAAAQDDDEEHDWEFNVDPPGRRAEADDDSRDAPGAGEGLALDMGDDGDDGAGSGLSLADEDEPSIATGTDEDSAFGSVDDYSSLMEEDAQSGGGAGDASAAPMIGEGDAGIGIETPARADAEAGRYAETGAPDDLGDPENWDFFGEGASTGAGTEAAKGSGGAGAVLGRIALAPAGASGDQAGLGDLGAWDDDAYAEPEESMVPGVVMRGIGLVGHAIGWTATLALVSVVLVSGFWSTAESLVRSPQEASMGRFTVRDLHARWVDTARGETLLAVRGQIFGPGGQATALGGTVEVSLLDATGQPLPVDAQPAGLPLAEQDVRELSPADLRIVIDRAAWQLAQETVAPGRPLSFEAIFREAPPEAVRLAVALTDGGVATNGLPAPGADAAAPIVLDDPTALGPRTALDGEPAEEGVSEASDSADAPVAPAPAQRSSALPEELTWGE